MSRTSRVESWELLSKKPAIRRVLTTGVTGSLGQEILRAALEVDEDIVMTALIRPRGSLSTRARVNRLPRNDSVMHPASVVDFEQPIDEASLTNVGGSWLTHDVDWHTENQTVLLVCEQVDAESRRPEALAVL